MYECSACIMCTIYVHDWCPRRSQEGVGSHGTAVSTAACHYVSRCWESNPSPLEEQPVLLTLESEPPLQPSSFCLHWGVSLLFSSNSADVISTSFTFITNQYLIAMWSCWFTESQGLEKHFFFFLKKRVDEGTLWGSFVLGN